MFSVNLAPIKYSRLTSEKVIENVIVSEKHFLDKKYYQVNAKLNSQLKKYVGNQCLYSDVDGSGTSTSLSQSYYSAVSEALERWAWYNCYNTNKHGFNIDDSTTGMAAYPGLFNYEVKRKAYNESVERYALMGFWEGKVRIECRKSNIRNTDIYQLIPNFNDVVVILLCRNVPINENDFYVTYGFAGDRSAEKAFERANIELERNQQVLDAFYKASDKKIPIDIYEKRLLFFSSKQGYEIFMEKINFCLGLRKNQLELKKPIIDEEVKGPWSMYTTVWRVLHSPVNNFKDKSDYFIF